MREILKLCGAGILALTLVGDAFAAKRQRQPAVAKAKSLPTPHAPAKARTMTNAKKNRSVSSTNAKVITNVNTIKSMGNTSNTMALLTK